MRDHLLGFPPALLALDPEPRVSRETPPRPPACVDARSGAVIDRAETSALVPADCKQIKQRTTTHVYGGMAADMAGGPDQTSLIVYNYRDNTWETVTPEAAPPSAPKFKVGDRVRYTAEALVLPLP